MLQTFTNSRNFDFFKRELKLRFSHKGIFIIITEQIPKDKESSYCVKDKNGLDYEIPQFEVKWMIQGVIFGT